jgi:cobalt/nickel transport system permease protein
VSPFPIDAYAYANRLRGLHPGEKILFAAVTVALCIYFRSPVVSGLALVVIVFAIVRLAGIPLRAFWRFLQVPLGFLLTGVLGVLLVGTPPGTPGVILSIPIGPWAFGFTWGSLIQSARILCASAGAVACTLFLAMTTPMIDLTDQLRRWHVPALFVELMMLIYRFIFVLLETASAMHTAQEARLGYTTARRALRSVGMLASNLYLRANARASALFTALTARGYTGELRVLTDEPVWSARVLVSIALVDLALLAVGVGARILGAL